MSYAVVRFEDETVSEVSETLELARKKSEYINYSESEELQRGRGHRCIKKNKLYETDDDKTSSDEEYKSRRTLEPPPSMPFSQEKLKFKIAAYSKKSSEKSSSCQRETNEFDIDSLPVVFELPETDGDNNEVSENNATSVILSSNTQYSMRNEQVDTSDENDKMLKKILDAVVQLTLEVRELKNVTSLHNPSNISGEDFTLITDKLPLANIYALTDFESFLEKDEVKVLVKKYFQTIGGNGYKDNIYRLYKRIFTNELGIKCSWLGQRNNFRIIDTRCITIAKAVILESHNIQEKEFETCSSEWFRQAKQRLQRQK